jgi:hypothetical protein
MPVASSRDKGAVGNNEKPAAHIAEKKNMSQEDAEMMAQMVFGDDIHAGKLTLQQAADYSRCAQEDYAASFMRTPEGKRAVKNMERMQRYDEMSASRKARLETEMDKSARELRRLQDRSENRCTKKLGLDVPRGKVFGHAR